MLIKFIKWVWSMRGQFIKYFITGLGAVALDMATLYSLKEYLNLRPVVAVIVNQVFILNFVFFVNKYWSFKAGGMTSRQMFRFFIVALGNYAVAVLWMWSFNEKLHVNYLAARITNIALAVSWNFLLYRYFVYRQELTPVAVEAIGAVKDRVHLAD